MARRPAGHGSPISRIALTAIVEVEKGEATIFLDLGRNMYSNLATSGETIKEILSQARLAWISCDCSQVEPSIRRHLKLVGSSLPDGGGNMVFHAPNHADDSVELIGSVDDRRHLYLLGWNNSGRLYDIEVMPANGDGRLFPLPQSESF